MDAEGLVRDIDAIAQLKDAGLREVVLRTWTFALEKGGYRNVKDVPLSAKLSERSLLDHVNDVNDLAAYLLQLAERRYHTKPDRDVTMAAAILHDVDKTFIQKRMKSGSVDYVDGFTIRDHGPAGAKLAAECGVPERICELIRFHAPFNYDGHLPPTIEGTILHYADLAAFDLSACQLGATPLHAQSVMLLKTHPLVKNNRLD